MLINPELRRNIWLDFTWHRTILTPMIIGLIVYFVYLTSGRMSSAETGFDIACLFIFIWGIKKASETVIEEVNNNTWDFQRQSSISPWQMTLGKLIGSTLFSWYGAFVGLLFYLILYPDPFISDPFINNHTRLSQEVLILLLGGLLGQGFAILLSMQLLPQVRRERNNKTFRYFLLGALFGVIITNICFSSAKSATQQVIWHDFTFAKSAFTFTSLVIFLGWTIIGLQRSFCKELQYQNIPWVWTFFNLFCVIYFSGFVSFLALQNLPMIASTNIPALTNLQAQFTNAPYYMAFLTAQVLTYVSLFVEPLNTVRYKKILTCIKENNIKEGLALLPWWTISFIFAIVCGLIAIIHQQNIQLLENISPKVFILTSLLFLQRDILLFHYFNFGKNASKATSTAVVYLFILYALIPLLLSGLNLNSWVAAFLPSWGQNTALAILSSVFQIALLGFLISKRWEKTWKSINGLPAKSGAHQA